MSLFLICHFFLDSPYVSAHVHGARYLPVFPRGDQPRARGRERTQKKAPDCSAAGAGVTPAVAAAAPCRGPPGCEDVLLLLSLGPAPLLRVDRRERLRGVVLAWTRPGGRARVGTPRREAYTGGDGPPFSAEGGQCRRASACRDHAGTAKTATVRISRAVWEGIFADLRRLCPRLDPSHGRWPWLRAPARPFLGRYAYVPLHDPVAADHFRRIRRKSHARAVAPRVRVVVQTHPLSRSPRGVVSFYYLKARQGSDS